MNLQIINFANTKIINNKTICIKNGGDNIQPTITWYEIPPAKSYSLIMEDAYSINGNTVHWFIPTIYNNILINGLNSYDKYGYYGPCPPKNTGMRIYVFILYSLDTIFNFDTRIKIESSKHFEQILNANGVKILNKEMKSFYLET
jgi:phosphatidylethanolamine-binding protein (PEBP) family uncharacterized protein